MLMCNVTLTLHRKTVTLHRSYIANVANVICRLIESKTISVKAAKCDHSLIYSEQSGTLQLHSFLSPNTTLTYAKAYNLRLTLAKHNSKVILANIRDVK